MSCEKYRDLFDSVIDKELQEPERQQLLAHLDACPDCSMQFRLYEKVIAGVEGLEEAEPPSDLTAMVMKAVTETPAPWKVEAEQQKARSTTWKWAAAFGVVFLLTLGTFIGSDPGGTGRGSREYHAQVAPVPQVPLHEDPPQLATDRTHDELAVVPAPSRALPNQELGIQLVRHSGTVEVYDSGHSRWNKVESEAYLNFGDRVRTDEVGIASLEYQKEKVALRVRPGSVLQVLDRQTLRVFAGNAWVSVKRKGTVFRAETPNAIASVRGTKFSVEVTPVTDAYRTEGARTILSYVTPPRAPRATTDLALYSTQVGLALMQGLAKVDIAGKVESEVKVYESTVRVALKDARGAEVSTVDLTEGFKSRIMLAAIQPPKVLTDGDFMPWREVMVIDQDVLARARAKAAGAETGPPAATTPPAHTGPATTAEPTSETEHASPFEDLRRH